MTARTTRRTTTIALALGVALTLGACTGSGTTEPSDGVEEGTTAGDGPEAAATEVEDGTAAPEPSPTVDYEPSPLEGLFSEAYGELTGTQYQSEQARAEQIVAQCMKDQGFEYIPADPSAPSGLALMDESDPGAAQAGTLEHVKEHGYGISTWDIGDGKPFDVEPGQEDPNQDYVDSLSESARAAYELALHGVPPTEEQLGSDDWVQDPSQGGCYGKSTEEVWNTNDAWDAPQFASLIEEMSYVATNLDNDPEVTAAGALWSSCMAQHGYPGLESPWEAPDLIHQGLRDIWVIGEAPDPEALAALRDEELSIALADFECSEESRFAEAFRDAQFRAEQEFIDAHQVELEALVEAIRAQRDAAAG